MTVLSNSSTTFRVLLCLHKAFLSATIFANFSNTLEYKYLTVLANCVMKFQILIFFVFLLSKLNESYG